MIAAHITQAVYEWETGRFDGWRNAVLGVRAAAVGSPAATPRGMGQQDGVGSGPG